jgi:hypothetical protein
MLFGRGKDGQTNSSRRNRLTVDYVVSDDDVDDDNNDNYLNLGARSSAVS